jgi:anthranilate phosphoribosyltransferase
LDSLFRKLGLGEPFDANELASFFESVRDYPAAEVGAVLGCMLGRHNGDDAAKVVAGIRQITPRTRIAGTKDSPTINIVGTGGGPSTFNISTATSFLLAAAGVTVIKTGSTAWRSKSGFMEVAMALGCLRDSLTWEQADVVARKTGIVFLPPALYPTVLRDIATSLTPNVFRRVGYYVNIIGPLLSPVAVDYSFIGASSIASQELLAEAAISLGDTPTCIVSAENRLDEVSPIGPTFGIAIDASGNRESFTIDPSTLPLTKVTMDDLAGLAPLGAARLLKKVLSGGGTPQQTEAVALNGAAVLWQLDRYESLAGAFDACMLLMEQGKPAEKIAALKEALKHD